MSEIFEGRRWEDGFIYGDNNKTILDASGSRKEEPYMTPSQKKIYAALKDYGRPISSGELSTLTGVKDRTTRKAIKFFVDHELATCTIDIKTDARTLLYYLV